MNLVNSTRMEAGLAVPTDHHGFENILVVVKGTYAIVGGRCELAEAQAPLTYADAFFGEPGQSSTRYECDFPLRKPRTDVLLNGSAYAPGGRPAPQADVTLECGPARKTIRVFGDRVWDARLLRGLTPSDPVPFISRELRYEFAFGGSDTSDPDPKRHGAERRNLVGVGFCLRERASLRDTPVANQEDPLHPITSPTQKPAPMSFGFVGRPWLPRLTYAGTYDQKWLDERFPFLPEDFDERYHQGAAEDQQCRHLRGGETVRLTNLTPEGRLELDLPEEEIPIRVTYGPGRPDKELLPVLDTVIIEPDKRRVILSWRASMRVEGKLTRVRDVRVGTLTPGRKAALDKGKRYIDHRGAGR